MFVSISIENIIKNVLKYSFIMIVNQALKETLQKHFSKKSIHIILFTTFYLFRFDRKDFYNSFLV